MIKMSFFSMKRFIVWPIKWVHILTDGGARVPNSKQDKDLKTHWNIAVA